MKTVDLIDRLVTDSELLQWKKEIIKKIQVLQISAQLLLMRFSKVRKSGLSAAKPHVVAKGSGYLGFVTKLFALFHLNKKSKESCL